MKKISMRTAQQAEAQQAGQAAAVPRTSIRAAANGQAHSVEVEDGWTLVELLRDRGTAA